MALRTSLIWHDEVMSDVVSERPRRITIGPHADATFTTAELGLPRDFALVSPGRRGYLLTLGGTMRGTICVDGVEQDVAGLIKDGFYSVAISGLDWGLIELDDTLKVFFQFCGVDDLPAQPLFENNLEQRASFAFSTLLHGALLFSTYQLYVHHDALFDAARDLTASYEATRPEVMHPVMARVSSSSSSSSSRPAAAMPTIDKVWTAHPIEKTAPTKAMTPAIPPGFHPIALRDVSVDINLDRGRRIQQLAGLTGGGPGETHGVGPGNGHGHDHKVGDGYVGQGSGQMNIGGDRKGTMCVGSNCGGEPATITPTDSTPTDDQPTLTEKDIARVIQAQKGRLRACYQHEVDRDPSLAGTIQMRFEISASGDVTSARRSSSTLRSDAVSDCLARNLMMLKFPAKGRAVVNYPFVFNTD